MGDYICKRLILPEQPPEWREWNRYVESYDDSRFEVKVALVGKYAGLVDSYVSMNEAFRHAGAACHTRVLISYIEAEGLEEDPSEVDLLKEYDGIFIPYGFGSRGTEGKMKAIRFARENNKPFLGICYGFQLAIVEFARNVCKLKGANTTEVDSESPHPVIALMPEQRGIKLKGATMRLGAHKILIKKGTVAHTLYGAEEILERHRHRWEVNHEYWTILEENGLIFSGESPDGKRKEILELPREFFFFASQFHGEFKSRPGNPDPEYYGFVKACVDKKLGKTKPDYLR
jgi:CTP synthase